MDLHKIPTEELRGYDSNRRREIVGQLRRELHNIRMDIFSARAQHSAKIRGLKKTLARLLTFEAAGSKGTVAKKAPTAAPAKAKAKAKPVTAGSKATKTKSAKK